MDTQKRSLFCLVSRINRWCLGTASVRSSKALLQQGSAESPHGWVYGVALDECAGAGLGGCLGSFFSL